MKKLFFFLLSLSFSVSALTFEPYAEKAVKRDDFQGNNYAIQFFAEWCMICQQQKFMLNELVKRGDFPSLKVYVADFDFEKDLRIKHKIERQSTIIVFKKGAEMDRSLGLKEKDKLKDFFEKALAK